MRAYPCWEKIGITRNRYFELLHFCRQYPEWRTEASSLIGTHGQQMDGMPHGTSVGNPVASAAERRAGLLAKIELIESCAKDVQNGEWYTALIQNACMARSYTMIDPTLLPTSNRQAFYKARQMFFGLLDARKTRNEDFGDR